jgi:hypothetical protein
VSLCILAGGAVTALAVSSFSLGWEHSVERTGWEETWEVEPAGLHLVEARVRGSGAGVDPGPGARREGSWWVWNPTGPPLPELALAASGATGGGWRLCHDDGCLTLGVAPGSPIRLQPCTGPTYPLRQAN